MQQPVMTDRLGEAYTLKPSAHAAKGDYYTAFVNNQAGYGRFTGKAWDVCLQIGGALYCFSSGGDLVFGYNDFGKSVIEEALIWFLKSSDNGAKYPFIKE